MAHASFYVGCTVPQLLRGAQSRIFPSRSALRVLRHSAFCYCTGNGTIKSKRKMDHLERTANNFRQEVITQAKVCGITNESETVKRLRLAIANKDFTFKAGQWVDFFIPGVSVVGGFSICSSPGLLEREGILELAVKHTVHPPAHWIHTEIFMDTKRVKEIDTNWEQRSCTTVQKIRANSYLRSRTCLSKFFSSVQRIEEMESLAAFMLSQQTSVQDVDHLQEDQLGPAGLSLMVWRSQAEALEVPLVQMIEATTAY
ncbi:oxidoreductase NAD-binding domain-containing protein 1 isoform X5 [Parus major]|uniref:oxidoreductase NAD-binding domain-containing protein 1 isoform X5 n=1 Tax=Parus major TaxID=9157 RepID=UPI00077109F8|nr:oxidoreductase NAD-binding domain-containing protein 1 isoform X5 [Parus major]